MVFPGVALPEKGLQLDGGRMGFGFSFINLIIAIHCQKKRR